MARNPKFERKVVAIRKFFASEAELDRLAHCFLWHTFGREGRLRLYSAQTLEQVIEAALDFSELDPEQVMDVMSVAMGRFQPGREFEDIAAFVNWFFDDKED